MVTPLPSPGVLRRFPSKFLSEPHRSRTSQLRLLILEPLWGTFETCHHCCSVEILGVACPESSAQSVERQPALCARDSDEGLAQAGQRRNCPEVFTMRYKVAAPD